MKVIYYGSLEVSVADDVADLVTTASTEFADAGRSLALPVACYRGEVATTVQMIVGVGIQIAVADPLVKDERDDPPRTLESFAWIRDEIESLQADQ